MREISYEIVASLYSYLLRTTEDVNLFDHSLKYSNENIFLIKKYKPYKCIHSYINRGRVQLHNYFHFQTRNFNYINAVSLTVILDEVALHKYF